MSSGPKLDGAGLAKMETLDEATAGVQRLHAIVERMHLRYDARVFRALFTGPLIIAVVTLISLLFLFGHLAVRLGS